MTHKKRPTPLGVLYTHPVIHRIHCRIRECEWPVSLWLPNLCAYVRIAACGKAFSVAFTDKQVFTVMYLFGFVANEASRYFAKLLNHCSTYGDLLLLVSSRVWEWSYIILIMLFIAVNRISATGLLLVLTHLYKRDYKLFLLLLELDIASHWLRVYSEISSKKCCCQHLLKYQNFLYLHPTFRIICAVSEEVMYVSLYLMAFELLETHMPVRLDMHRMKYSRYGTIMAIALPGYIMRLIATIDEIRLATALCLHFDNQPICHEKVKVAVVAVPEPCPAAPSRRHLRRRTRSVARSRSRCRYQYYDD